MQPIFLVTLRALGQRRRLLAIGVLLVIPALLAVAYITSAGRRDGGRFAVELFGSLVLPIILPLVALVFATSALGGEIEDRTLLYLTLRPVSRLAIVVAKLGAVVVLTLGLVELSLAGTYLIAVRGAIDAGTLGAILLGGLGGSLAYASLFLLLGLLIPRRALIVGFLYVLVWEGTAAGLSTALATLSIRRYVVGALDAGLGRSPLAAVQPASVNGAISLVVLALVVVGGVGVTTTMLRRLGLP